MTWPDENPMETCYETYRTLEEAEDKHFPACALQSSVVPSRESRWVVEGALRTGMPR
jgi:hypothetical protein